MPDNLIPASKGAGTTGPVNVHADLVPGNEPVRLTLDNRGRITSNSLQLV